MQGAREHCRSSQSPIPLSSPPTPPPLDDSCVFICLTAIKREETLDRGKKKHTLTHHLQGCYLAGGQEKGEGDQGPNFWVEQRWITSALLLLSLLFFFSLSSFHFLSRYPLGHTHKFTRRSVVFRWLLDRFWAPIARAHFFKAEFPSLENLALQRLHRFKYTL